jgi:hypothetical protein
MPRPDFIPRRDRDFLPFARNFTARLVDDPPGFGVSAADAAALQVLMDSFDSAMSRASEPATRTSPSVCGKVSARGLLATEIRRLSRIIRADVSVNDAQRRDLGLTPTTAPPVYNGPPQTRPLLQVQALHGNRARLRLTDADSPLQRGKPPGTVGAILFIKVGADEGAGETAYTYAGLATTGLHTIQFPPEAARREVLITARWFNLRGEEGPQALPARTMGLV